MLTSQKSLPGQLASLLERNPFPCLHFRDPLSDGVPVLLPTQRVHRLSMNLSIDDDVRSLRLRINDFEFVVTGSVEGGGQFLGQIRGHSQIILPEDAAEKARPFV